jgi:hypothetical protein
MTDVGRPLPASEAWSALLGLCLPPRATSASQTWKKDSSNADDSAVASDGKINPPEPNADPCLSPPVPAATTQARPRLSHFQRMHGMGAADEGVNNNVTRNVAAGNR